MFKQNLTDLKLSVNYTTRFLNLINIKTFELEETSFFLNNFRVKNVKLNSQTIWFTLNLYL